MLTRLPHPKLVEAAISVLQAAAAPGGAGIQERHAVGGCWRGLARASTTGSHWSLLYLLMYLNYEEWLNTNVCKVKYSVVKCIIDLAVEGFPSLYFSLTSRRKCQVIASSHNPW